MRTFEYRIYPNRKQRELLMSCLIETRHIYNEMLASTKQHYQETGRFLFKYDLTASFKGHGRAYVPASTVQMLADRLDKALKRFLECKMLGLSCGFPRYKTPNRWHSIQLRQYGRDRDVSLDVDAKHLRVPAKLGKSIKIKLHRPLHGIPKTVHLVFRADRHWYALIVCEMEQHGEFDQVHEVSKKCSHPAIGLDVGLKSFLADSDGNTVENPRYYRRKQKQLRRKQRTLCRRKKGSNRRKEAARDVAKTHLKIRRQRRDFYFKIAKRYAVKYQRICVENLNIAGMVQNHNLAKSIHDAGWSTFLNILEDKAARAGHQVIGVNPCFTTQKCSNPQCGELVYKSLSVRTHKCPHCGYIADRDVNAALNILRAGAPPSGTACDGRPNEPRSSY